MTNTTSMENIVALIILSLLLIPSLITASQFSVGVSRKNAEPKLVNGTVIIKAPQMVIGGRDDVAITRGNRSDPASEGVVFRCHSYDLRPILEKNTELQITEITPIVNTSGSDDIVHHMDIFACQPKIVLQIPENG